jgi:hypothetical protein
LVYLVRQHTTATLIWARELQARAEGSAPEIENEIVAPWFWISWRPLTRLPMRC